MKKDIQKLEDIKLLVDTFYGEVPEDEKLKNIFNNVVQDRRPEHLEKLYPFWQVVLLGDQTYYGSPIPPPDKLPVSIEPFEQWLKLLSETVDSLFASESRTSQMAR